MTTTLLLAIYGSIVSTALAYISIINFLRQKRILSVDARTSFTLDCAYNDFVISNISSKPFTIIDCMTMNLARTEEGKLEPDWGIAPRKLKNLFGDREADELILPITLHAGEVLIVGIDSDVIIEQFSCYARTPIGTKNWTPTEIMVLEINHSMNKIIYETQFKLQGGEIKKAEELAQKSKNRRMPLAAERVGSPNKN